MTKIIRLYRSYHPRWLTYSIGHLYDADGHKVCDTIEDTDRGLTDKMSLDEILSKKVKSRTAIPRGRYRLTLDIVSPKFVKKSYYRTFCAGKLPRLLNVPGFEGILIHKGTTERDSAGCIIVGYNTIKGMVTKSQEAFEKLYRILYGYAAAKEKIFIEII